MQTSKTKKHNNETSAAIHHEVEKRYLAYALSTIVSRALPDVRDGLKPVHRRILYAMHGMRLGEGARMRKSAAIVGEVIGKYHPHGDQAAYDALVRMAQDFSLRYPLIEGSGNFGSVDGDSPAAMRYTETRLSLFAGLLLKEIDQGTTEFRPTYDGMGEEPLVLPAAVPNLLVNGASGIAVGMSCSFPPHNLKETIAACRAVIKNRDLDTRALVRYLKGPDFPTGGQIIDDSEHLTEIYETGHGSIRVRGTFDIEKAGRGKLNLIITSIPYSVNKSRLIERIAQLIKEKKLRYVQDLRDESTQVIRIVLELRGNDVRPESVMAFLYKHSDLQINFPVNLIAITPQGMPDRLSLTAIIRYFLDFRYEKTVLRLQYRLDLLQKRIHLLEGFKVLFQDLDQALKIIRGSRSKAEAEEGLKLNFGLDDEQVEAILEMRLYKLVGLEIGKILDELSVKKREAEQIRRDLESPERLWKMIDKELAETAEKFGDERKTEIVPENQAPALEYDPDEFVEHDDTTVIVSKQGWIRRIKSEIDDESSLKFRENDSLLGWVRVNTGKTVAIFSNFGKLYVIRALDVPATAGFGEPIGSLLHFNDGECVVGIIAPDSAGAPGSISLSEAEAEEEYRSELSQESLFDIQKVNQDVGGSILYKVPSEGILVTKKGRGFRFDYGLLRELTKRAGRRFVSLKNDDEVIGVKAVDGGLTAIAADSGNVLVFPVNQVPVLAGPAQGVRLMKLPESSNAISFEILNLDEKLKIKQKSGKEEVIDLTKIRQSNRDSKGKKVAPGLLNIERIRGF